MANVPLPDLLRPYEAALRILPHKGDVKALTLKAGQALAGTCDVAVRVGSVAFANATARFALEAVGLPRVGERRVQLQEPGAPDRARAHGPARGAGDRRHDCAHRRGAAHARGLPEGQGHGLRASRGRRTNRGGEPAAGRSEAERRLARVVVAWPRQLLSVDAIYRDPSGKARHERLVGFEAVVGTDGRLYKPQVKMSVDPPHETAIQGALSFWRFEPARRADAPVGARVPLEIVLRVY